MDKIFKKKSKYNVNKILLIVILELIVSGLIISLFIINQKAMGLALFVAYVIVKVISEE